jgi:hypothetical protein
MGIPPQAARLAGAWAVRSTAPDHQPAPTDPRPDHQPGAEADLALAPEPERGSTRRPGRDRSHRISVSRILHPLHRHV